jgi:hypothetical protein
MARSDDLESDLNKCPEDLGEIHSLSRDHLSWRVTIRPDGALILDGIIPYMLQWDDGIVPPSEGLEDQGLRLTTFTFNGKQSALRALHEMGAQRILKPKQREERGLFAEISSPHQLGVLRLTQ